GGAAGDRLADGEGAGTDGLKTSSGFPGGHVGWRVPNLSIPFPRLSSLTSPARPMPVLLIFQILIPLILIGRVATARRRSRHSLEADIVLAAVYLLAVSLARPAIAVPWYLPGVVGRFLAAASARPLLRPREAETSRSRVPQGLWTTLRALAILGLAAVSGIAVLGHRSIPGQAVELAFPLDDGVYLVANGGSNPMVNLHLQTLNA